MDVYILLLGFAFLMTCLQQAAVWAGRTLEEGVRRGSGLGPGVRGCRAALRWAPGGLGFATGLGTPILHPPGRLARDPPWTVLGPEETCVSG